MTNCRFAAIAFATLGGLLLLVAALIAATDSVAGAVTMGLAGAAIAALGVVGWKVQQRWYIEIDDDRRMIEVSGRGASRSFAPSQVSFRLPRSPSLMPASVQYLADGAAWCKASGLGQGQSRTPPQLLAFGEHLQRVGIPHEWV